MTLAVGLKLGDYEILGLLGVGGMGEVYRARDTQLHREIALKVLPQQFRLDPHRIARFTREAQVLSALNHPNIATLHTVAEIGGVQALVLELVEGDTLAERIAAGSLSVKEALAIGLQIAAALGAAHEHGVVHRDMKPANVKLRPDGTVKLLDFGLAKILDPSEEGDPQLATVTALDLGRGGAALGTPAYMSPEQTRGLKVDRRGDIWAFGCVLYEMLTGKRAFEGPTGSDTLAAILEHEPDWSALRADCPSSIRRLVRRCLTKDRNERVQHIGDARIELRDATQAGGDWTLPSSLGRVSRLLLGVGAAVIAGVVAAAWWVEGSVRLSAREHVGVTRFEIVPPNTLPLALRGYARDIALSGDGKRIGYSSADGSLVLRALADLDVVRVANLGPELTNPVFSPDGGSVAFLSGAALKRVSLRDHSVSVLADIGEYTDRSATWGADDSIIVASTRGLLRAPAGGGTPELLAAPDAARGEKSFGTPELLPGGRWLLHTVRDLRAEAGTRIVAFDLVTRERKELVRGGTQPRYLSTGHLVYAVDHTLQAVAFDLERLEIRSAPAIVAGDVMVNANGTANYAVADDGTLAYVPSTFASAQRRLAWVTRDGREEVLAAPSLYYTYPRLSPDGKHVALDVREPEADMWTWDLERGVLTRITFDAAENVLPVWSPDGRYLAFGDGRSGASNIYRQPLDGGPLERLTESGRRQVPMDFTPDGAWLLFAESQPNGAWDTLKVSLDGTRKIEPVLHTEHSELNAALSPDGRWLAYSSNESGRFEIYARPFPDVGREHHRISRDGGSKPLWSRDGHEIFFVSPQRQLMAAAVDHAPQFAVGVISALFDATPYTDVESGTGARSYDLSLDGTRFLMLRRPGTVVDRARTPRIVVVLNWLEEVDRLVP